MSSSQSQTVQHAKPRRRDGQLRFGLMWPNSPSPTVTSAELAVRNPDVLNVQVHMELARTAEAAGIDFVFFADGYTNHGSHNARVGHGEPCISAVVWAPAVMAATRNIGVVTTMHTRYLSPVVLARLGANLDVLSGGRWGWNIVPGSKADEARLFGINDLADHDERYAMARECVEAVKALWQADQKEVDFSGKYYKLKGIPRGPYPVQSPWPLLFNAGVSEAGQELTAALCDYAFFAVVDDLDFVKKPVESLAARAERHGRAPNEINMAGSIGIVLGSSSSEAQEKYQWISESVDMEAARGWARAFLGRSETYQSIFGDLDFDDAARRIGISAGSSVLVGTPEEVAEQILHIYRTTGLRGFMLAPPVWHPAEVARIGEVLPHLERAGAWTAPQNRGYSW